MITCSKGVLTLETALLLIPIHSHVKSEGREQRLVAVPNNQKEST